MAQLEWILGSVLSLSGWRLDVLFVRVVRAGVVLFAGLAFAVSPPVPHLASTDARMDARTVIDTVGYAVEETDECVNVMPDRLAR